MDDLTSLTFQNMADNTTNKDGRKYLKPLTKMAVGGLPKQEYTLMFIQVLFWQYTGNSNDFMYVIIFFVKKRKYIISLIHKWSVCKVKLV